MAAGDAQRLGVLMYGSHVSMRDDFEISTDALNAIVEIARLHDACYGARLTGAGFGGCGVALIRADAAESFVEYVEARYRQQTDHEPQLYVCRATDGAQIVE
jgi:galactokinase